MRRSEEKKKRKESVENLWETVLSEVVEQSSMKPSYLIFLGRNTFRFMHIIHVI
jgi:hypothetical protein